MPEKEVKLQTVSQDDIAKVKAGTFTQLKKDNDNGGGESDVVSTSEYEYEIVNPKVDSNKTLVDPKTASG